MHLAASLIAFGSLAATAAAAAAPDFVFPDPVLLQRRQAGDVSDENYKCHENCGMCLFVHLASLTAPRVSCTRLHTPRAY